MALVHGVSDPDSPEGRVAVRQGTLDAAMRDPRLPTRDPRQLNALLDIVTRCTEGMNIEGLANILHTQLQPVQGAQTPTLDDLTKKIIECVHNSRTMTVPEHYTQELQLKRDGSPRHNHVNKTAVFITVPRGMNIVFGQIAQDMGILQQYLDRIGVLMELLVAQRNKMGVAYRELLTEKNKRRSIVKEKNETLADLAGVTYKEAISQSISTYCARYKAYHRGMNITESAQSIGYLDENQKIKPHVRKHELGSVHMQKVEAAADSHLQQALKFRQPELDQAGPPGSAARRAMFNKIVTETNQAMIRRGDGITPGLTDAQQRESMFAAPIPAAKRMRVTA